MDHRLDLLVCAAAAIDPHLLHKSHDLLSGPDYAMLLLASFAEMVDNTGLPPQSSLQHFRFDHIGKFFVSTGKRSPRRRRTNFADLITPPDTHLLSSLSSVSIPSKRHHDPDDERNNGKRQKMATLVGIPSHSPDSVIITAEEKQAPMDIVADDPPAPPDAPMEIVADDPPAPPAAQRVVREPPAWIAEAMRRMNGQDPRLVTEKTVKKSDVNRGLSRLLIPFTAITDEDFLTEDERRSIDGMYEESKNNKKKYAGFQVKVIDPMLRTWDLALKRWNMEKSSKNGGFSSNYSLQKNWNRLAEANGFEEGDELELWSFRAEGQLRLAVFTH